MRERSDNTMDLWQIRYIIDGSEFEETFQTKQLAVKAYLTVKDRNKDYCKLSDLKIYRNHRDYTKTLTAFLDNEYDRPKKKTNKAE